MAEEFKSSPQEHPFAQKAREVAEGIKGSEAVLEEDRAQLRRDMVEVKGALMEANRHLPGMVTATALPGGFAFASGDLREESERYRTEHQVVLLNEPVTGEGGLITYVAITPAGFKSLTFPGVFDEKLIALEEILQRNPVFSDELNGYYELQERNPISGKAEGKPIPQILFGGLRSQLSGVTIREGIDFKGEDLIDVSEDVILRAYTNSQEVAAGKLKKEENVDTKIQGIQGQRAIGERLLESMRQQPPPPPAGQS